MRLEIMVMDMVEDSQSIDAMSEEFAKAAGAVQASLAKAAHLFAAPATQAGRTRHAPAPPDASLYPGR